MLTNKILSYDKKDCEYNIKNNHWLSYINWNNFIDRDLYAKTSSEK